MRFLQPNLVMIGQDNNEAILRSHLEERYGILVEFGTALTSFEENEDGVVVHLVKSRAGVDSEECLNIKWLVGADGANGIGQLAISKPNLHNCDRTNTQTCWIHIRWRNAFGSSIRCR